VGVNLFLHSVRLVLNDWRNALRITGILYLIYAIPSLILTLFFPVPRSGEVLTADALAVAPVSLLIAIFGLVAFVWIAVAWHRYILLDEMPEGQIPVFDSSRLFSYAVNSLGIGVVAVIAAIVVGAIAGALVAIVPFLAVVAAMAALAAALIIGYRLSPILPAAAIGKPLMFGQAWQSTNGANVDIIVLAVISAIASFVIDIPAWLLGFLGGPGTFLALLWLLATAWLKMLVGVSIVTTIYGYYVEKRQLPTV
jgi:hypothetical protein